jgi:cell division protein FtsQ
MASSSDPRSGSSENSKNARHPPAKRSERARDARSRGSSAQSRQRPRDRSGEAIAEAKRQQRERRADERRRVGRQRLIAAAAVAAVLLAIYFALTYSPAFAVKQVEVTGASHLTSAKVVALAAVPSGATLLRLPSAEIRARLVSEPWISDATVHRVFPSTVRIDVTERRPAAVVDSDKALWLVDSSGFVIAQQSKGATSALVLVRDAVGVKPKAGTVSPSQTLANALAILEGVSPQLRSAIRAVSTPSIDETALMTKDGVEVLVGSADELQKKDYLVRQILAQKRGKVVFIDVRTTSRPVSRGLKE